MAFVGYVARQLAKKFTVTAKVETDPDMRLKYIESLTKGLKDDGGMSKALLHELIKRAKTPELREIIKYLRSPKADGIDFYERAQMVHEAAERIGVLKIAGEIIKSSMGGG